MAQSKKPPTPPKIGRPTDYTKELGLEICRKVSEGDNLDRIGRMDEFPNKSTLYAWLEKHSEFSDEYERARERRADSRSDRIDGLREQVTNGLMKADVARIAFDMERWQAGKENPKKYGDKTDITLNGKLDSLTDEQLAASIKQLATEAGIAIVVAGSGEKEE